MSVIAKWFGNALLKALNKEVNWATDIIKVMLCTSTYAVNQDTHIYRSSVTNEVVGTGYTAGGATLGTKTITYDNATNVIRLSAAATVWTASTITARFAVIYVDTGTAGTSTLLGYVDFGQDQISFNGEFRITWNANGIFRVTVD